MTGKEQEEMAKAFIVSILGIFCFPFAARLIKILLNESSETHIAFLESIKAELKINTREVQSIEKIVKAINNAIAKHDQEIKSILHT